MIRWIIFIVIFAIIDFYAFQAVKTSFRSKGLNITYIIIPNNPLIFSGSIINIKLYKKIEYEYLPRNEKITAHLLSIS